MNLKLPTQEEISTAYHQGEEAVLALFVQVNIQFANLAQELEKQAKAIKELQAKLSKNSSNSGKPPSSDGYGKSNRTESQRKKGQKPNGGQNGHEGSTLKATDKPDKTETHPVDNVCANCKSSLKKEKISDHEERQVFDIPAIHIEITAHKAEIKICPKCGAKNKGNFPDNVTQPTQYGSRVKTWASYFSVQHFIPTARTSQIFEDLVDHRVSQASIIASCHKLSQQVAPATQAVKAQLQQADVAFFDETGIRVKGKLHWLHSASTNKLTYYTVHPKRGQVAMDEMGILSNFTGTACHDHWKPYFNYEEVDHALCNAHHLRELAFLEKQHNQVFAPKMANLLIEINQAKKTCNTACFERHEIATYEARYHQIVQEGFDESPEKFPPHSQRPKRGRTKQTPAYNMLRRLRDFQSEVLKFMYDFRVPFTNNQAEQDVRMIKVKQKVSNCFRTTIGAEEFVENRAYISTARKNEQNVFRSIHAAFENNPFIPCS